jgi:hypothetical protein
VEAMRKPANNGVAGREFDLPEDLRACCLERAAIRSDPIDGADRRQNVDHDGEEHDQDGDEDFRIDGKTIHRMNSGANATLGAICRRQDIGDRAVGRGRHAEHVAEEGAEQAAEQETRSPRLW